MCTPDLFQPVTQLARSPQQAQAGVFTPPGEDLEFEEAERGGGIGGIPRDDEREEPDLPSDPGGFGPRIGGRSASKLAIRGLRELNARARADLKIPFTPVGPDFNNPLTGPRPRPLDPIIGVA